MDRQFWAFGFVPIKSPPTTSQYLSIQSSDLSAAVWPQFQCQILWPASSTLPLGGYGGPKKNGTNQNVVPTFLFDFNTHQRAILHRLVTIHNAADRQTVSQFGIGLLCYSIGGLKTMGAREKYFRRSILGYARVNPSVPYPQRSG